VHRWSVLIIVQRDETQSSLFIILQVHSTCFGCQPHPSLGVHKTVTTAPGTVIFFVQLPPSTVAKLAWPRWRNVDDRCGWHTKHVERTCRIINRLPCVASRWTIINILYIFKLNKLKYKHFLTNGPWNHIAPRASQTSWPILAVLFIP